MATVDIFVCHSVSHNTTRLPSCKIYSAQLPIMKLFAYNDNTHKISPPKGPLAKLIPINLGHFSVVLRLFSVQCRQSVQVCSNNCCLVSVRYSLVPAVLILN